MIFFDDDFDFEEAFYMGCIRSFIEQSNEEQDRSMRTIREEDDTDDREDLDM